jgi:serine/threonine protein kinase
VTWAAGSRSADALPPGQEFGDYVLEAELGRGGMGVVYRARQKSLNRTVAVKMVLSGALAGPEDRHRFRTEAEAAARLQHPNIVTVHDVGEIDGRCYYSMEYVAGRSLAQLLDDGPVSGRQAARYVETVARAIHHAHTQGILHRDLKPGNVLLDHADQPHVTDFGLAKRLGDTGHTRTGDVLGTPRYMAPEQAAGQVKELGPATDIYALGAILYELVTGRPPFAADSVLETVRQVLDNEPAPPTLLNPHIDADLETIILKCLEKDPRARYGSAEALADDLRRYLDDEPIQARTIDVLDRLIRTLDRSHFIGEFRSWGSMVLIVAAIVLVEHLIVFALRLYESPEKRAWHLLARLIQFGVLGGLFWKNRRQSLWPTSSAERQLFSIWIGYLVSCYLVWQVPRLLSVTGQPVEELPLYPSWAILSGLAFFVMGSNYWGWCYAFGAAFFGLALLMPLMLPVASLAYGVLWTAVLVSIGLHLRKLGRDHADRAPPAA